MEKHAEGATGLPTFHHAGRFAGTRDVGLHHHHRAELILVTEGHCGIHTPAGLLEGYTGTLFILPASAPHDQLEYEYTRTEYVTWEASPLLLDDAPRILDVSNDPWISRWLSALCDLYMEPSVDPAVFQGLLYALLNQVRRVERQRESPARMHPTVRRAAAFVDRNLASALDARSIAAHVGVSVSYLGALFRAQFQTGPMQYVQRARLGLARRLLADPYLTVQQVAHACGYEDANYFSRLFRKVLGLSPTEYRRESAAA